LYNADKSLTVFVKEKNSDLTRTQVIELYRSNMKTNFQDERND